MVQPEEVKFFGIHDPEIGALAGAARKSVINELPMTNPELARLWDSHKRSIMGLSKFGHYGGRFPLTGVGKINTYSLFAETARNICSPTGRIGLIVPSGVATNDTTKVFFADLVNGQSLVSLYDFENREAMFPDVDRTYKFCLLTISGPDRPIPQAEFAFFLHRTEQLQDVNRRFALAPVDFALFNPNTRTCPVFRTRKEADIAAKLYQRAGVFWKEARGGETEANPWGVHFSQMFNMTSDSGLFFTKEQLKQNGWRLEGNVFVQGDERYLPLYEAKLFHQYDHRFATFDDADRRALTGGNARDLTGSEKADPEAAIIPRYWVPEEEVIKRLDKQEEIGGTVSGSEALDCFAELTRSTGIPGVAVSNETPSPNFKPRPWLQVFRGITKAVNERTALASNLPQSGVGHSAPVITYGQSKSVASALVLANLNSLPLDWAARLSVGGFNMDYYIIKQLPVLPPGVYLETAPTGETWVEMVVPRVLELTYTAWDLQPFAQDLGYDGPPFVWDEERRHRLKCELDAIYAHLYQLDREDLAWILDAPEPSRSFPGLKRNEERQFGEYRTQRYVLQAYDLLAQGQLPNLDD